MPVFKTHWNFTQTNMKIILKKISGVKATRTSASLISQLELQHRTRNPWKKTRVAGSKPTYASVFTCQWLQNKLQNYQPWKDAKLRLIEAARKVPESVKKLVCIRDRTGEGHPQDNVTKHRVLHQQLEVHQHQERTIWPAPRGEDGQIFMDEASWAGVPAILALLPGPL